MNRYSAIRKLNLPRKFETGFPIVASPRIRSRIDHASTPSLTAGMRFQVATLAVALLLCAGCASKKQTGPQPQFGPIQPTTVSAAVVTNSANAGRPIITPDTGLSGKVVSYNETGRFVVISFPLGRLPAVDQRLFVYRQGLKSGEVKADRNQQGEYAVADLVSGEAQPGDEVRDK